MDKKYLVLNMINEISNNFNLYELEEYISLIRFLQEMIKNNEQDIDVLNAIQNLFNKIINNYYEDLKNPNSQINNHEEEQQCCCDQILFTDELDEYYWFRDEEFKKIPEDLRRIYSKVLIMM